MQDELVVRRFEICVCLHDIWRKNKRFRGPFVDDLEGADIARKRTVDNEVIPEAKGASFRTYDTIIIMPRNNYAMQTMTREREGEQVALRIDMKHDGVKYFRGLAREGATGRREPDKGFDNGDEV